MSGPTYVIGVPKELKADEYRVAMIPVGVAPARRRLGQPQDPEPEQPLAERARAAQRAEALDEARRLLRQLAGGTWGGVGHAVRRRAIGLGVGTKDAR